MKSLNINYDVRIDELRGLACLLVFITHFSFIFAKALFHSHRTWYTFCTMLGAQGVAIFFILSGYLFTTIFLNKKEEVSYRGFIYNRFLRIFPLFIVLMLFIITCYPSVFKVDQLIYFFTFQWNILIESGSFSPFLMNRIDILWTIAVEFQFYLIFLFLFKFYKKHGIKYCYYLLILLIIISYCLHSPRKVYFSIFGQFPVFIIGIIFAVINHKRQLPSKNFHFLFFIVSFLLMTMGSTYIISHRHFSQYGIAMLSIGILSFITIFFYVNRKDTQWFPFSMMRNLGTVSYSFYLTHRIIIAYSVQWGYGPYQSLFLAFILTVLLSILTYHLIEKPFMDLRKKY